MNCAETGPLQAIPGPRASRPHDAAETATLRGLRAPRPHDAAETAALRGPRASCPLSGGPGSSRTRPAAQRIPTPAGKPLGAVLAALGIMLLLIACSTSELPWYWTEGAPGLWGLAAGALIASGMLICYLRFTLRFFLLAVAIAGCSAAVSHGFGCFRAKTTLEYYHGCTNDLVRMVQDGLIGTLEQEGAIATFPCPISMEVGYKYGRVHFRPHTDRRVSGMSESLHWLCEASCYHNSRHESCRAIATEYIEDVRVRFGGKAAIAVARRSAELAPTGAMRESFLEQAQRLQNTCAASQ